MRYLAQAMHRLDKRVENIVDIRIIVGMTQGEPQAALRQSWIDAH